MSARLGPLGITEIALHNRDGIWFLYSVFTATNVTLTDIFTP